MYPWIPSLLVLSDVCPTPSQYIWLFFWFHNIILLYLSTLTHFLINPVLIEPASSWDKQIARFRASAHYPATNSHSRTITLSVVWYILPLQTSFLFQNMGKISLKKALKRDIVDFAEHTSAHGIPRAYVSTGWRRGMWSLCCLICVSCFVHQAYLIVHRFNRFSSHSVFNL